MPARSSSSSSSAIVVEAEVLPPVDLVLAPVPLEELREDPLRFLVAAALDGKMRRQRLGNSADARQAILKLLLRRQRRRGGSWDGLAALLLFLLPAALQPFAQLERREAVIAVVREDGLANVWCQRRGSLLFAIAYSTARRWRDT